MKNKRKEAITMSNEWKIETLGGVANMYQPKTISQEEMSENGDYAVYGANGVIGRYDKYNHETPQLLVTCRGATCGTINISAPFSWITGNSMVIQSDSNVLDVDYLKYFLGQDKLMSQVITGAAQPQITRANLSLLKISFPKSLDRQREIAAVLDKANELVEKRKAQLIELDLLAESIFYDMFGDPVTNEKGWDMKTIEKLVVKNKNAIKRGPFGGALKKEIFVEDGYLVYEQFHALNNDFSFGRYYINEKKYKELIGFAVVPNDIIISCSGVNLGKLAVIPDNSAKGIINQALLKITLNNEIITNSLFVKIFTNENFKDKYFGYNRGCAIPNFPPMSDFKQFQFICPPLSLQQQFAERIEKIEEQKAKAKEALKESENLFQRLMQDMFNPEYHNS